MLKRRESITASSVISILVSRPFAVTEVFTLVFSPFVSKVTAHRMVTTQ